MMSVAGGGQAGGLGGASTIRRRGPASGMWRSQSCLSDLDQEPGISQVRMSIFYIMVGKTSQLSVSGYAGGEGCENQGIRGDN